jgi:hypothetical protein
VASAVALDTIKQAAKKIQKGGERKMLFLLRHEEK